MESGTGEDRVRRLVISGWDQLKRQRPLAAWACWQQVLRLEPGEAAAVQALERLKSSPVLPEAARRVYRFRSPNDEPQRLLWDGVLGGRDVADLSAASGALGELCRAAPDDADAHYNLGLCRAWLGDQEGAIAALGRFVDLRAAVDFEGAADAWTLAEVLRHGGGAEELADDRNFHGALTWEDDQGDPAEWLGDCGVLRLMPVVDDPARVPDAGKVEVWEWLDRPFPNAAEPLDVESLPRVLAVLAMRPGMLEYSTPRGRRLHAYAVDPGPALLNPEEEGLEPWSRWQTVLPLSLLDAAAFTFRLPGGVEPGERGRLTRAALGNYYENHWIHVKRRGLSAAEDGRGGLSPLEAAAGGAASQARVEGVIRLREQMGWRPGYGELYASYPFDRLRRRLGLPRYDQGAVQERDYSSMSHAELAGLDVSTLTELERERVEMSLRGLRPVEELHEWGLDDER